MRLSGNQRTSVINDLVNNCEEWRGYGDRELLDSFPDDKLVALHEAAQERAQAVAVANAAVSGFSDSGTAYRVNPDTGRWEKKVTGNAGARCGRDGSMDDEEEDAEDGYDDEADEDYVDRTNKRRMTGNRRGAQHYDPASRPRTLDEMIRSLPSDLQNTLRVAQEIEQREKDSLIAQILTNSAVPDTDKQAQYERLQRRTVDELRNDLALLPKMAKADDLATNMANRRRLRRGGSTGEDVLGIPTINWEDGEVEGMGTGPEGDAYGESNMFSGVNNLDSDYGSDEEFLRSAPPRVRSALQNAMAIEAREKQKIIDQLTANVQDEDTERRLGARLRSKSLEELQELLQLTPAGGSRGRPSYFGSVGGPTSNAVRNGVSDDDVLLPPTMTFDD